jgi:hypothetical protein
MVSDLYMKATKLRLDSIYTRNTHSCTFCSLVILGMGKGHCSNFIMSAWCSFARISSVIVIFRVPTPRPENMKAREQTETNKLAALSP